MWEKKAGKPTHTITLILTIYTHTHKLKKHNESMNHGLKKGLKTVIKWNRHVYPIILSLAAHP